MIVLKLSAVVALAVLAIPGLASYGDDTSFSTSLSSSIANITYSTNTGFPTTSRKFTYFKNTRFPTNFTVHFPTSTPPASLATSTSTSASTTTTNIVLPTNMTFPDDPKTPDINCTKPNLDGAIYKTGNGQSYRAMCYRSYPGFLITTLWASSFGACASACSREEMCMAFNFVPPAAGTGPGPAGNWAGGTGTGGNGFAEKGKGYDCELKSAIAATPDRVSTVWGGTKIKSAVTVTLTSTTRLKRGVEAKATGSWTGVGSQSEELIGAEPTEVGGMQTGGNRLVRRGPRVTAEVLQ